MGQSSRSFHNLLRWLTRPTIAIIAVCMVAGTMIVRVGSGSGLVASSIVPMAAVLVAGTLALIGVTRALAGYDDEADEIADRLIDGSTQRQLLTRWLERARWARYVGGFAGILAWLLGTQTQGDVLVFGSLGICCGAVLAEAHHFRRPSGPRRARLEVRDVHDYLDVVDARRMTFVAAVALATIAAGGLVDDGSATVWWGSGALTTLSIIHLAQRRVASRSRPAVPDELRLADDLARRLAIGRGLAVPATYAALALVARGLIELGPEIAIAPFLGIVAWCYGVALWWRNRRLGLDFLIREVRQVAVA
jgi:hypothetical protein